MVEYHRTSFEVVKGWWQQQWWWWLLPRPRLADDHLEVDHGRSVIVHHEQHSQQWQHLHVLLVGYFLVQQQYQELLKEDKGRDKQEGVRKATIILLICCTTEDISYELTNSTTTSNMSSTNTPPSYRTTLTPTNDTTFILFHGTMSDTNTTFLCILGTI